MRNILRKAGIIAFAAVIGLAFFSCGPAEDDPEMKITITGIPSAYDGSLAQVFVVSDLVAWATDPDAMPDGRSQPGAISGGSVTLALLDPATVRPLVGKAGTYAVLFAIEEPGYQGVIMAQSVVNATTSVTHTDFTKYGSAALPIQLYPGEWEDVWMIEQEEEMWFSISVTNQTRYNVWWDDAFSTGSGMTTIDVCVAAKYEGDSTFTIFGAPGSAGSSSSNRGVDTGYSNQARPNSAFTANKTGTVLVRVLPERQALNSNSEIPGFFGITYTIGNDVRPSIQFIPPVRELSLFKR